MTTKTVLQKIESHHHRGRTMVSIMRSQESGEMRETQKLHHVQQITNQGPNGNKGESKKKQTIIQPTRKQSTKPQHSENISVGTLNVNRLNLKATCFKKMRSNYRF